MPRARVDRAGRDAAEMPVGPAAELAAGERIQDGPERLDRPLVRCDLHVHTNASSKPAMRALGWIDCPECYSEPERVYDQARARGMDLVAVTDHDTIAGAMALIERGYQGVIVGQEVSVQFPEDRCKLHVLVWGLTPELDEQLAGLRLREDVYAFAGWLRQHNLAHSLAHPLYSQNGKLTRRHLDRCVLLFRAFEVLNGAHAGEHRTALERYLESITPSVVHRMVDAEGFEPLWPRVWEKVRTAGSDDHGLLNIGRTWTGVDELKGDAIDGREFLKRVMTGRAKVGGVGGHSSLLAHQLTTVAANYAGRVIVPRAGARVRFAAGKVLRFAGVDVAGPSAASLAWEMVKRKLTRRRGSRLGPLVGAVRSSFAGVLARYPAIADRLEQGTWTSGSAMSQHEDMAAFFDDLYRAVHGCLSSGAFDAVRRRDKRGIIDHAVSCLVLELAQAPYIFSLFHQNKDRIFVETLERQANATARPGGHPCAAAADPANRPMRVLLFTDTYADVNGPSRFIGNIADQAVETGRDLRVFTSTRLPHKTRRNVTNFEPLVAMKMPRYDTLDLAIPPLTRMLREVDRVRPDVIHISTPGPVGLVGLIASRMMRCPVVGVYHTDFPAYIDRLFDDHVLTQTCSHAMRMFYKTFRAIFTRSEDYAASLERMGIERSRLTRLLPGIDLAAFNPGYRDVTIWDRLPAARVPRGRHRDTERGNPVRVLYCGRVSVEKNLPMLTKIWKGVQERLGSIGSRAELVIVGDGPYRPEMEKELTGWNVRFLGFRHGHELSAIYASSDMFVFPSVTDTLGQVVMESQASGLPVLVTDQGGPKEVVEHGRTGLVLGAGRHRAVDRRDLRACRGRRPPPIHGIGGGGVHGTAVHRGLVRSLLVRP